MGSLHVNTLIGTQEAKRILSFPFSYLCLIIHVINVLREEGHYMTREKLEQRQILIYAVTLMVAAIVGMMWPTFSEPLGNTISFVIAILLFSMFTQIPFLRLKETLSNRKFIYALLVTNYVAVPLLVWLLTRFIP